jgi:MFS family permease
LIATGTAGAAIFLSTLDSGIINVALPSLQSQFHVDVSTISLAITLYMSVIGTTIVLFGRLADRFGRTAILSAGFALFGLASLLCGCSGSALELNLFRVCQGFGAAMMQATAAALITTLIVPERRRVALGTFTTILGLGPVMGPTLGGVLLSTVGWRPLFWLNLPICLLGLAGCRSLRRYSVRDRNVKLDLPGNVLLACGIFGLLSMISGWSTVAGNQVIAGVCVLSFLALGVWEARCANPILEVNLLRRAAFFGPAQAVLCVGMTIAVVLIIPPFLLQRVHHLPPWAIGLICLSAPLGIALTSRLSGQAVDSYGAREVMVCGGALMSLALIGLSLFPISLTIWEFASLLLLYGIGYGIYQTPNLDILMGAVPSALQGTIGAVQRMLLNVGNAFGATVCALFLRSLSSDSNPSLGIHACWLFAAITMGLTLTVMILCHGSSKQSIL